MASLFLPPSLVGLSVLDLCGIGLSSVGLRPLLDALAARALSGDTRLRVLELGGNDLRAEGEAMVVSHMETFCFLDIARDKPEATQQAVGGQEDSGACNTAGSGTEE